MRFSFPFRISPNGGRFGLLPPVLAAACWLAAWGSAQAKIEIEGELGFGRRYVAGHWTPLRLTLENFPDPQRPESETRDFKGRVRVSATDREGDVLHYVQPLELGRQSRKAVELAVQLPEYASPLRVELIDEREGVTALREFHVAPPGGGASADPNLRREVLVIPTILLMSDEITPMSLPGGLTRLANVVTIAPGDLPVDPRNYQSVHTLVVRERMSKTLSGAQLSAVERWLRRGGQLVVITPRAHKEIQADPWLERLLPAAVAGVEEARLGALEAGSGDEITLVTRWGRRRPGAYDWWQAGGRTLALARRVDGGRVLALAVDPSSLSSDALTTPFGREVQNLTESLIFSRDREDVRARHFWSTENLDPNFSSILVIPNIWVVSLLLIAFVVLVGPANFYILRKRRRLELAWVTIPALSIVFFVAVYVYGVFSKGGDQHYASAGILHLDSGGAEGLMLWSGIQFSPSKGRYGFAVEDGGAVSPLMTHYANPANLQAGFVRRFGQAVGAGTGGGAVGAPATAVNLGAEGYRLFRPLDQWSMAFYAGEQYRRLDGTVEGSAELYEIDGELMTEVRLNNASPHDLYNAVLWIGEMRYPAGDLKAGERLRHVYRGRGASHELPPGREASLPQTAFAHEASHVIRDGALHVYPTLPRQDPQRRVRLIAEQQGWVPQVAISPDPDFVKQANLIEVKMPVEIRGEVELSTRDALRREVYRFKQHTVSFFDYRQADILCSIQDGSAEFAIGPPEQMAPVEFVRGEVELAHRIDTRGLLVQAYNFQTGNWDEAYRGVGAQGQQQVQTARFSINRSWVHPMGAYLRLRLEATDPSGPGPRLNPITARGAGVVVLSLDATMRFRGKQEPAIARSSNSRKAGEPAL